MNTKKLAWGETPFTHLNNIELQKHCERLYSALLSSHSVLRQIETTAPFWSHKGVGGRALKDSDSALEHIHKIHDKSDIYHSYFRYANDLLFPETIHTETPWRICSKCGEMLKSHAEQDTLHKKCFCTLNCNGTMREMTWEDLQPKNTTEIIPLNQELLDTGIPVFEVLQILPAKQFHNWVAQLRKTTGLQLEWAYRENTTLLFAKGDLAMVRLGIQQALPEFHKLFPKTTHHFIKDKDQMTQQKRLGERDECPNEPIIIEEFPADLADIPSEQYTREQAEKAQQILNTAKEIHQKIKTQEDAITHTKDFAILACHITSMLIDNNITLNTEHDRETQQIGEEFWAKVQRLEPKAHWTECPTELYQKAVEEKIELTQQLQQEQEENNELLHKLQIAAEQWEDTRLALEKQLHLEWLATLTTLRAKQIPKDKIP